jgi:predicted transport protein
MRLNVEEPLSIRNSIMPLVERININAKKQYIQNNTAHYNYVCNIPAMLVIRRRNLEIKTNIRVLIISHHNCSQFRNKLKTHAVVGHNLQVSS